MTLLRNQISGHTPVELRVVATPLTELVVAMWAETVERDDLDSFENAELIRSLVRSSGLTDEQRSWMAASNAIRWSFLLLHIVSSTCRDLADLVGVLAAEEPEALVASLLQHADHPCEDDTCEHDHLEVTKPDVEVRKLIAVLESIDPGLVSSLQDMAPGMEHEAHLTSFLSRRLAPEPLIESVTNGIAYRIEPGVTEVVLLPSKLIRPWNLMFSFQGARFFVYPMSDEAVAADPDTPPGWMVEMFKSLGDERRLRLMRRLGEGPANLGELAATVDLAKSTTHHHLRLLRAAGLVRAVVSGGEGKESTVYELRPNALADATRFVAEYLRTPPIEEGNTP